MLYPFQALRGERKQNSDRGEEEQEQHPRTIHAGPTNQAVPSSTHSTTGGERRQMGQKRTRDGRLAEVAGQPVVGA